MGETCDLILIRHAPAQADGRLAGRRDVPCDLPRAEALAGVASRAGAFDRLRISPALRCRQTAAALFGARAFDTDPRLWEQDFGAWEGLASADLPDPGPLDRAGLAALRPPGGESFADLHARIAPALRAAALPGRTVIVAHAGTVRVALSLALGAVPAGLAFDIAPLSVTHLRRFAGGGWAIQAVNVH